MTANSVAWGLFHNGQWETRLKNDFQDVFGDRQARRFMEIARNKMLAIELNKSDNLTLEGTIKAISEATPEQLDRRRLALFVR